MRIPTQILIPALKAESDLHPGLKRTGIISSLLTFLLCILSTSCQEMPHARWVQLKEMDRKLALLEEVGSQKDDLEQFEMRFKLLNYEYIHTESEWALFRDSEIIRNKIEELLAEGEDILIEYENNRKSRIEELSAEISIMKQYLDLQNSKSLMLNLRHRLTEIQTRLLLAEAYLEYGKLDTSRLVLDEIKRSSASANMLMDKVKNRMENLDLLAFWEKTCRAAFDWSKNSSRPSLLVIKDIRQTWILKKGDVSERFPIELGWNGLFDKIQQGDGGTPEGRYKVTAKKKGKQTKYFLALLLDYPNALDHANFNQAVSNGEIDSNARIGGLIEIHGNGGRGQDWTDGCIALKDSDMEKLFQIAWTGMPVTIVGRCGGELIQ